jgi:hypothetical protein
MAIEYDFHDRLALSQGISDSRNIRDVLLANIPGALNAHPAHVENDRNGTDWWIEHVAGHHLSVDCKVREEDWYAKRGEDDLALETWSVVEANVPGWTRNRHKRTDYVLWFWLDTGRWCLVPFAMLCRVFSDKWQEWSAEYKTSRQRTPRSNGTAYHSECVFVPRREVWAAIYRVFGGHPL